MPSLEDRKMWPALAELAFRAMGITAVERVDTWPWSQRAILKEINSKTCPVLRLRVGT